MTYSVHLPPLIDLFCTYRTFFKHTPLSFIFFSVSNTSSWPSLHTSEFYDLFCSFTFSFLRLSYRLIFYGYLCTYLWWPNLYTYFLLVTHSVQLDYFEGLFLYTYFPMFDLFSISTTSSWPICTVVILWPILFIYFSLVSLPIHVVFYGTHHWWPIL